jgi:predicted ester cyclase
LKARGGTRPTFLAIGPLAPCCLTGTAAASIIAIGNLITKAEEIGMKQSLGLAVGWLMLVLSTVSTALATPTLPVLRVATMSLDDEKSLSRRAIDRWASNNPDTAEDIFAANYINHQEPYAAGGTKALSLEAWRKLVREYHSAFSNSTVGVLMQIAEGDLVATQWQITAAQTGSYLGHPSSGKTATWTGVSIDRIENGKIVESWVNWDKYSLFEGLGLLN